MADTMTGHDPAQLNMLHFHVRQQMEARDMSLVTYRTLAKLIWETYYRDDATEKLLEFKAFYDRAEPLYRNLSTWADDPFAALRVAIQDHFQDLDGAGLGELPHLLPDWIWDNSDQGELDQLMRYIRLNINSLAYYIAHFWADAMDIS